MIIDFKDETTERFLPEASSKPHRVFGTVEHQYRSFRKRGLPVQKFEEEIIRSENNKKKRAKKIKENVRKVFTRFFERIMAIGTEQIMEEFDSTLPPIMEPVELCNEGIMTTGEETEICSYKHNSVELLRQNAENLLKQFPDDAELKNMWNRGEYAILVNTAFKRDTEKRQHQSLITSTNRDRNTAVKSNIPTCWDFILSTLD